MIDFSDISQRLRQLTHSREPTYDRRIMHPAREWYTGLVAALLVIAAGAWWATVTYVTYRDLTPEADTAAVPVVVYRESQVERALTLIDERSRTFAALAPAGATSTTPAQTDPPVSTTTPANGSSATDSNPEMTEPAAGTTSEDVVTPNATSGVTTSDPSSEPPADAFPISEEVTPQF